MFTSLNIHRNKRRAAGDSRKLAVPLLDFFIFDQRVCQTFGQLLVCLSLCVSDCFNCVGFRLCGNALTFSLGFGSNLFLLL